VSKRLNDDDGYKPPQLREMLFMAKSNRGNYENNMQQNQLISMWLKIVLGSEVLVKLILKRKKIEHLFSIKENDEREMTHKFHI